MELKFHGMFIFLIGTIVIFFVDESTQSAPISNDMWLHMRNITDVKDFVEKFLRKKPSLVPDYIGEPVLSDPMTDIIFTEEGSLTDSGSSIIANMLGSGSVAEDRCEIKMMSVPVSRDPDPSVLYWPSCAKLEQCSGCCNNEMLKCVASVIQIVESSVMSARYPYVGADYFTFEGIKTVQFERHLGCDCRCRTQASDCNSKHRYDPHSCSCRCMNEYEANTCDHPKIWNNTECRCVCPPNVRSCYDDETYNEMTCRCTRIQDSIGVDRPTGPVEGSPCEMRCRTGYVGKIINGVCACALATHGTQQEGSLVPPNGGPTNTPHVPLPPINQPPSVIHVPNHPQLVSVHPETTTTVPPRRPKPTRPRPSRRFVINH